MKLSEISVNQVEAKLDLWINDVFSWADFKQIQSFVFLHADKSPYRTLWCLFADKNKRCLASSRNQKAGNEARRHVQRVLRRGGWSLANWFDLWHPDRDKRRQRITPACLLLLAVLTPQYLGLSGTPLLLHNACPAIKIQLLSRPHRLFYWVCGC